MNGRRRREYERYSAADLGGEPRVSLRATPFSQLRGDDRSLVHLLDIPFFRTHERHRSRWEFPDDS